VKAAIVKQRRQLADGHRLVNVVCPACDGRHWLPDNGTGQCPRRPATFTITHPTRGARRD
jgi:hypothetical protein